MVYYYTIHIHIMHQPMLCTWILENGYSLIEGHFPYKYIVNNGTKVYQYCAYCMWYLKKLHVLELFPRLMLMLW